MGAPVACASAILFFACPEAKHLLPKFSKWMMLRKRCVDYSLMLWKVDSKEPSSCIEFEHFVKEINSLSSLNWKASLLRTTVNFLDLTLTVTKEHYTIVSL